MAGGGPEGRDRAGVGLLSRFLGVERERGSGGGGFVLGE
ncbi:hypothetical protein UO65_4156 [Actinokineospora spheciospongiae]|uniref:Uncharacterized protein n=1 Tax=Actinokineospora spheciospongiae TaxID=909613 RepID=W7J357_9PSEU|nr:hypothetical protein UO65_4156 [Actinokineospora spheciospongiae]